MTEWKKLRRTDVGGIERVCHYPRNQIGYDAPCYGCVDRVKCNHDIFERLAQYEDTDLTPTMVAEYKRFEDELAATGLTLTAAIKMIREELSNQV